MKFIILGHCNSIISCLLDIISHKKDSTVDIISNIENIDKTEYLIDDLITFEFNHDTFKYYNQSNYIFGVNSPKSKLQVYQFFLDNYKISFEKYTNLIAETVNLPKVIQLGNGIIIHNGVTIAPYTKINNGVTINRNCSIGHHNIIEKFVTINPGVNIAGHCHIKENTLIGIGVTIINNITIGKNVIIGAGSVVTKDIPDNTVYYGVPAKFIRFNQ